MTLKVYFLSWELGIKYYGGSVFPTFGNTLPETGKSFFDKGNIF
jgi:hypothetical protein